MDAPRRSLPRLHRRWRSVTAAALVPSGQRGQRIVPAIRARRKHGGTSPTAHREKHCWSELACEARGPTFDDPDHPFRTRCLLDQSDRGWLEGTEQSLFLTAHLFTDGMLEMAAGGASRMESGTMQRRRHPSWFVRKSPMAHAVSTLRGEFCAVCVAFSPILPLFRIHTDHHNIILGIRKGKQACQTRTSGKPCGGGSRTKAVCRLVKLRSIGLPHTTMVWNRGALHSIQFASFH